MYYENFIFIDLTWNESNVIEARYFLYLIFKKVCEIFNEASIEIEE